MHEAVVIVSRTPFPYPRTVTAKKKVLEEGLDLPQR